MLRLKTRRAREMTDAERGRLSPYEGVMAELLHARGITTREQADAFLNPGASGLHSPMLMRGMGEALGILEEAKQNNTPAAVYGDYDADGVCACALVTMALGEYGVTASPYVPLRDAGYGLNEQAVRALAGRFGVLITVDLGITNHDEVRLAQSLGMRVIVTDHHRLPLAESPADAVLSPLLGDYPYPRLCGAGVAFKLAQALLGGAALKYLDLAALATVADIVPLTGENRAIVALGLPVISSGARAGIAALLSVSGAKLPADSHTLGFRLGPRLNAAGRLGDANTAVRLMLTRDDNEACELARELDEANARRRAMESALVKEAAEIAREHDFTRERALIIRGEGWHPGVIGLVAGRLCQTYACPCAVLTDEKGGLLRGSLRSVPGVNIHECLTECADVLVKFGGHEQAAGVTLKAEDFAEFSRRLQEAVSKSGGDELFMPVCEYDMPLSLSQATCELAKDIERLAPFGEGNPPPLFLGSGLSVERRRACGADGSHLQVTFRQRDTVLGGVGFGMGGDAMRLPDTVDAVFSVNRNEWQGRESAQCVVEAMRPAKGALRAMVEAAPEAEYENALLRALIKAGETALSEESNKARAALPEKLDGLRGALLIARAKKTAAEALERFEGMLTLESGAPVDATCVNTLLTAPDMGAVRGHWRLIALLDGEAFGGEAGMWGERFPNARIACPEGPSDALRGMAGRVLLTDDGYRGLYKLLRAGAYSSPSALASAAGVTEASALSGLYAFSQLGLISFTERPFSAVLLPPAPCSLYDSPLLIALRRLKGGTDR